MLDANHPIWATVRLILFLIAMVAVLWMNASHFDDTEIKAIVEMFLVAIGIEGGVKALKPLVGGKKE